MKKFLRYTKQFKNLIILSSAGVLLLAASFANAKTNSEPSEPQMDGGDTYNFYFQKSDGTNKVEQGKSQKVEAAPKVADNSISSEVPTHTKSDQPIVDLYGGRIGMPARGQVGINFGAEFFPKNYLGFRVGYLGLKEPDSPQYPMTQVTGAVLANSKSNSTIQGADLALMMNVIDASWIKIAPMAGAFYLNQSSTNNVSNFDVFGTGSKVSSETSSQSNFLPYIGLSLSIYFSRHFGLNGYIALPNDKTFVANGVNFVVSI